MAQVTVAFDVGPLIGTRTGVGTAVAQLRDALERRSDLVLAPYVTSYRARPEPGTTRLPLPAAAAHRMWSRIDRPRVDRWLKPANVVHGTNYVVPPTTLPRLVSVYDCWFLRHPELAHPDVRRAGAVLRRSVEHGAIVHASSHATADALHEFFPAADVRVVHLGAIPLPTPPDVPPIVDLVDRTYVLAIGTLERRKNLPMLVRAFAQLASLDAGLVLVLAGNDGDDRGAIDAAITAAGPALADRILLTGRIDEAARSWLLHHAAVLAYPSLDEGFGFPLLDAMQAEIPIVASGVGSIPEVAGSAALLVSPSDLSALAGALSTALSDDARRAELVAAGRAQVATFSWESTADQMAGLYHELETGGETMITVLCGGVGAARFLRALRSVVDSTEVTAVVNTGDDTVLHGLSISPDLDTITYTLAGATDPTRGWGLVDETWTAMSALQRFESVRPQGSSAAPTWFNLGDKDLATHFYRTARLREGADLTTVSGEIALAWGLGERLLPMSDDPVATMVELLDGGTISFQEYFVKFRHEVPIRGVSFAGADHARLSRAATTAIIDADVVVIAPSNPIVSIGPMRSLNGFDRLLVDRRDRVVAISPIVGGAAIKGPADRMLSELGHQSSVVGVAHLYAPIASALVIDPVDAHLADDVAAAGIRPVIVPSVMSTPEIGATLARATLAACS